MNQPSDNMQPEAGRTRKERRELERQRMRENTGQDAAGAPWKKIILRCLIGAVAALVLGGFGWLVFFVPSPSAREMPGQAFPIQGQAHIQVGASHEAYNSNPPTSGSHYEQPEVWGVYETELPDEQLIHNLEHGGIWISYKNIDATTKASLEKIARSQSKVIMAPRAKNNAPVVLASWGRLQEFQAYDERTVLAFIEANRNQSPEPLAQ